MPRELARGHRYRHFASREDLPLATVAVQVDRLAARFAAQGAGALEPRERILAQLGILCDFCAEEPAFMDAAILLLRLPYLELAARVSAARRLALGRSMAAFFGDLAQALREEGGTEDPDTVATALYLQVVGAMYAARHGVGIRRLAPGVPQRFSVGHAQVRGQLLAQVDAALASGAYAG